MDRNDMWGVITDQRRVLADLLEGLAAPDWDRPSLCSEWRVRDVAAHVALTPQSPGVGKILVKAVRARGDFDRLNRDLARAYAGRPPAVIVDDLRSLPSAVARGARRAAAGRPPMKSTVDPCSGPYHWHPHRPLARSAISPWDRDIPADCRLCAAPGPLF